MYIIIFYYFTYSQFDISLIDGDGRTSQTTLRCSFDITRNNFTPYFMNLPNTQEINSTLNLNQVFFRADGRDNDPAVSFLGTIGVKLEG